MEAQFRELHLFRESVLNTGLEDFAFFSVYKSSRFAFDDGEMLQFRIARFLDDQRGPFLDCRVAKN